MDEITYKVKVSPWGAVRWYRKGKLHREDGPAVVQANGSKYWYRKGKLHRIGGPGIEYANGSKLWYLKGKLHRLDGPAVESCAGSKFWYIHGEHMVEEDFNDYIRFMDGPTTKGAL